MSHNTKKKILKKKGKPRSISAAAKKEPNKEKTKKNYSFNNSLELDYLNFTQIDLFKLDQSFEDDIFTPNNNIKYIYNKNNIISNRYEDSNSNLNDYSNIKNNNTDNTDNTDNDHIGSIKGKEYLINTPSTICNYYEISSNKKISSNYKVKENDSKHNSEINCFAPTSQLL